MVKVLAAYSQPFRLVAQSVPAYRLLISVPVHRCTFAAFSCLAWPLTSTHSHEYTGTLLASGRVEVERGSGGGVPGFRVEGFKV